MRCKLCGGLGIFYGNSTAGTACPVCGGTGMARATVSTPAEKTLLDEFAIAAMAAIIGKHKPETVALDEWATEYRTAIGAYDYATAMMQERNRRDEMGNMKEVTE